MPTALQEFNARMDDTAADIRFVALAATLRPRLGAAMNWGADADVVATARSFMNEKSSRLDAILSGLLVRAMAALERYFRQLVEDAVNMAAAKAKTYENLPKSFGQRNMLLTGRLLASIDAPREHISFDYQQLIENLASCRAGRTDFRLNGPAFSATVTSASPAVVERALQFVEINDWLDAVAKDVDLQRLLETRKARDTAKRIDERLLELWRWRNQIAHGGDQEIVLSAEALEKVVDFVRAFAAALDREVYARLGKRRAA
jgi:RiboL-PSP-HEPN